MIVTYNFRTVQIIKIRRDICAVYCFLFTENVEGFSPQMCTQVCASKFLPLENTANSD